MSWLARYDVPLMVSARRTARQKTLPRARGPWFRDSGGFTELSMYGCWQTDLKTFIAAARRDAQIGNLAHCAPQDWMCEPEMLRRTGLDVAEHQRRTVDNFLALTNVAPELPWVPVLQGWTPDDYLRHVEQYTAAGVDLAAASLVGVGTLCRRQATHAARLVLSALAPLGLKLHGFGLKTLGLRQLAPLLASADSMAWSYDARRTQPLPGCQHRSCANCARYALAWRDRVLTTIDSCAGAQLALW